MSAAVPARDPAADAASADAAALAQATAHCMAPACAHPTFVGREAEDRHHVALPDGRTFHFACHARLILMVMTNPPTRAVAVDSNGTAA